MLVVILLLFFFSLARWRCTPRLTDWRCKRGNIRRRTVNSV